MKGSESILVIGPGAIGAAVGASLAAAGTPVVVACRSQETARGIQREGLRSVDLRGRTTHASVSTVTRPSELEGAPAWTVLATKCFDAEPALRAWKARLGPRGPVVAMQNGLMGDRLAPLLPGRLAECVVAFPATLLGPGHSQRTGPGGFVLGPWPPRAPESEGLRLEEIAETLRAAGPVQVENDVRGHKWTKLLINSAITTLGAVTGRTLGDLLAARRAREAFLAITTEGHRAGRAEGVRFAPLQRFRPGLMALPDRPGRWARAWRHALLRAIGRRHRRHKSSSLQSLERGARTEVDYLNGEIVSAARRHDLAAPVNEALVALAHRIEAGRARPDPAHLEALPLA